MEKNINPSFNLNSNIEQNIDLTNNINNVNTNIRADSILDTNEKFKQIFHFNSNINKFLNTSQNESFEKANPQDIGEVVENYIYYDDNKSYANVLNNEILIEKANEKNILTFFNKDQYLKHSNVNKCVYNKNKSSSSTNSSFYSIASSNNIDIKNEIINDYIPAKVLSKKFSVNKIEQLAQDVEDRIVNEIFEDFDIPKIVNKHAPQNSVERDLLFFANLSLDYKKKLLNRIRYILFVIDVTIILLSGVICTVLYLNHFDLVKKNYKMTSSNNKIKIACLLGSFIQITLLILRDTNIRARENIKFFLNYSNKPSINSIVTKTLVAEIIFHILQPYPYLHFDFEIIVMGKKIKYSIDMLLYLLCVSRFYYLYLSINQRTIFSSERSKRIIKFLNSGKTIIVNFKAILKYYGLSSIFLLFLFMTYLWSLIFKVLEDFDLERYKQYNEIVNALWYIINTITTSKFFIISWIWRFSTFDYAR